MKRLVLLLFVVLLGMLGNAGLAQRVKIPLPEGAVARLGKGVINDMALSADGRYLAIGTSLGIELRDSDTLELISFFASHTGDVNSIAVSPDGRILASGAYDGTIKLWNVASGGLIRTLIGHTDWVNSVAFSPDGRTLASGSHKTIKLWDAASGRLIRTLTGHKYPVKSVAFSPDGRTLASGAYDGTIKLWDVASGDLIRTLTGHTNWVNSVAFSPNGRTLASGSSDETIKLWDVASGDLIRTLTGHTNWVNSIAFSPNGRTLVSGSNDDTIKLWDVASGRLIRTRIGHMDGVNFVAFSPDGHTLASGSWNNTIELWDVASEGLIRMLTDHTNWVRFVAFSPDGRTLASGSWDDTVKLWDVASGGLIRTLTGHMSGVNSVAFSPDGRTLASGSYDKTVKLWDVTSGELIRTLNGHTNSVISVAFSPGGRTLASGSYDKTVKLWDVTSGELICTLNGHTNSVISVAFSPDGRTLASGSYKTIKLWDVASGGLIRTLTGHTSSVWSVAFSPDGHTLASGSWDNTIKLWDVASGGLIRTLNGHTNSVYSVAFSPDGHTLASGSWDNTIKLWDVASGDLLRTLKGHTSWVNSIAFSPDGSTFASGSEDGTILLWDVDTIFYPNTLPLAHFTTYTLSSTGARLVVQPRTNDRVWFDASESSDHNGRVVKYEWDWQSDGSYDASSKDPVIGHMFTTPGTHKVTLQVTDDKGGTATVSKTLTVDEKQPPTAQFTYTPVSPTVLDTMHFTDTSSDPDGRVTSWEWEFGDGSTSSEQNPTHHYTQKKMYTVSLTVTDNDDLTATVTKQITVVNLHPEATFSFTPNQPYLQQPIAFDASSSTDKDGTITKYAWDFGDESVATGEMTSHTFAEEGTFTVVLTITDDDGATASHQEQITVKGTPPGPPRFKNEWGLVVGIADYQDPSINDLKFTENDAQAFYNFLVDRNGSGFPKDHVQFLLGQQATGQAMQGAFKWLIDNAEKDDLVVIYYAGHGSTGPDYNHDEQDRFDEYLIPYDAQASDLFTTAIRDDEIGDWLASIQCTHILLVFDSCFSGGATRKVRSFNKEGMRAGPGNQVFTDLTGEGRLVLAASQEDEPSYEDPPLNHGVFTYFLLQGLGVSEDPDHPGETTPKADTNEDGRVTVEELQIYLNQEVPQYIKDVMHEQPQHPMISGDTTLRDIAWNGYGVPLEGEVTTIQHGTVIISLGSRQGIQPGDQFEVIRPLTLPDGTVVNEVEATIEVLYTLGPNRAGCKILKQEFPVQVHDRVQPVNGTGS